MTQIQIRQGFISKQSGYKIISVNNKIDNRIENLIIVTRSEHKKLHHPKIGIKTRLQQQYFFNKKEIINLYLDLKSTFKIAKIYNCNQKTIERFLRKVINKPLREYALENGWNIHGRRWK